MYRLVLVAKLGAWKMVESHEEKRAISLVIVVKRMGEARYPWGVEVDMQYKLAF